MSGTYVAKPAVVPEDDRPPGWGDWPWPGPFPPGFDWRDYEWPGLPGGGKPSDDDDRPGEPATAPRIVVYPVGGLRTREADRGDVDKSRGGNFLYVVLSKAPEKGSIYVPISSRDDSEGEREVVSEEYTTFEEFPHFGNEHKLWSKPRRIWLAGKDDNSEDGDVAYSFKVGPSSSSYWGGMGPGHIPHPGYNDIYGSDVQVTNIETVWELRVYVSYATSGSLGSPTGEYRVEGSFTVSGPEGTGKGVKGRLVRSSFPTIFIEAIEGGSEFNVMAWNCVSTSTGVRGKQFGIEYVVTAGWSTQREGGSARSEITVIAELYRDEGDGAELQKIQIDTIFAYASNLDGGGGFAGADTQNGSMEFTAEYDE